MHTHPNLGCDLAALGFGARGAKETARLPIAKAGTIRTEISCSEAAEYSFLGLPYRILNLKHKKELLWSLWVMHKVRAQEWTWCLGKQKLGLGHMAVGAGFGA